VRVALLVDGRATLADIPNTLRGLLAAVGGRSLRRLPVEWCGLAYWTADHGEDHAEQLAAVIWAGGVPVDRVIVTGWSRGECAPCRAGRRWPCWRQSSAPHSQPHTEAPLLCHGAERGRRASGSASQVRLNVE